MQDDFYGEPSGASLSWGQPNQRICVGQWRGGLVVSVRKAQATVMGKGTPKFWPDANGNPTDRPVRQLIITVMSGEKDANNPVDTGMRTLYIEQESLKYSKNNKNRPGQPKQGVKFGAHCEAMVAAGHARELPEPGGLYYLRLDGETPGEGSIPRAMWSANYQPPTPATLADLNRIMGTLNTPGDSMYDGPPNGQQTPPAQTQQPAGPPQYQPAQQPAAPQQFPSYAGAPAASNHPQWGPNGGPQEQYAPQQAPANAGPPQQQPQAGPPNGPPQYQSPAPPQQPQNAPPNGYPY